MRSSHTLPVVWRECVVHAASLLTLLLAPWALLCVYRRFSPAADEWALCPLPTVVGAVDARRFRVVMRGNGAWSSSAREAEAEAELQVCVRLWFVCCVWVLRLGALYAY